METKPKEEWRPVSGYEGYYEVSNLGRVKSAAIFIRHDGNWAEVGGYVKKIKIKNQNINRYGYKAIKLCKLGKCKTLLVHRLVALAFIPTDNPKNQINHMDGNKENNTIENLEWVTAAENMQHAWATGLVNNKHMLGSNHHSALLNEEKVREIRRLHQTTKPPIKDLAEKFGVSVGSIKDVIYNRTWKAV